MAKSLIALLTRIGATKTPDEIVAQLKHRDWIKGADMPAEIWQEWTEENKTVAICYQSPHGDGGFSFSGIDYRADSYTFDYVTSALGNHWFMLMDCYQHGVTFRPDGTTPFGGRV